MKGLILGFNRMANKIGQLLKKANGTETTRSNLLLELGHDLRTPLTSLSTSFEALKLHYDVMGKDDREDLFSIISSDIRYFKDLLEKLTTVATLEGPQSKASSESVNLAALLRAEICIREKASPPGFIWDHDITSGGETVIFGDPHLITRLFKNAFDNATRYASSIIRVRLTTLRDSIEVTISDDGPGLTPEQLRSFGKRRERRELRYQDSHEFSLGLGSVIMKTIVELHDGSIIMANGDEGALLKVSFKKP